LEVPLPEVSVKVALLVSGVLLAVAGAVATICKTSVLPEPTVAAVKVAVLPVMVLEKSSGPLTWLAEVRVIPVGSASLRETLVAAVAVVLVRLRVKVAGAPTETRASPA
jgi:hypothetical protein